MYQHDCSPLMIEFIKKSISIILIISEESKNSEFLKNQIFYANHPRDRTGYR